MLGKQELDWLNRFWQIINQTILMKLNEEKQLMGELGEEELR